MGIGGTSSAILFSIFGLLGFGLFAFIFYLFIKVLVRAHKSANTAEEIKLKNTSGEVQNAYNLNQIKLLASLGYTLILMDVLLSQLYDLYQLYVFGYHISLITLIPFIIFYVTQKDHPQLFVREHAKGALNTYLKYIIFSVINGIFFEALGSGISYQLIGIGLSIVMLCVVIWVFYSCTMSIIKILNATFLERTS